MKNDNLVRPGRRQTCAGRHLLGAILGSAMAFSALHGIDRPAYADDGSLEMQKGGLFHRKGFVYPEIYQPKKKSSRSTSSTTSGRNSKPRTRVARNTSRTKPTRTRRSSAKPTPRRRLPQNAVKQREQKVSRTASPAKQQVRVASLTQDVPSANSTKPSSKSVTGGSARVRWAANSRCIPSRLRNAIYHVARNYGRVRVNSTCRSRRHNRRVGGASRSYHLTGQAADIRVFGNIRAAARYLRRVAGGYKHYGGGLFHIDTGPKRSW